MKDMKMQASDGRMPITEHHAVVEIQYRKTCLAMLNEGKSGIVDGA